MSHTSRKDLLLTRRHVLALAAAAVSGCGGGAGVSTAALPGTGGTGIYTQGSISGFSSVKVNGITFDDLKATVLMDGGPAGSKDLRIGMVASVQGERGADLTLGTASRIEVWSIAQGPLRQAPVVTPRVDGSFAEFAEFSVAGMTVQTNPNTSFYGVAGASALAANQVVTVWGLQAGVEGVQGTRWTATCVVAGPMGKAIDMVSTGVVHLSGSQRLLNGLSLSGAAAGTLSAGALVRVQGSRSEGGMGLLVTHAKVLGSGLVGQLPDDAQIEVEIEGVVTDTPTANAFMLGNIRVDASAMAPISVQIKMGTRLEVHGTWQSGVLKASKVEIEDDHALQSVEIKGTIESFKGLSDFVVRGQRCDASNLTNADVRHGLLADLNNGINVKLKGTQAGNVLIVTELEIDD